MESEKHYSLTTRNEVLDKVVNQLKTGKEVSREFNIPYNTVMRWVRQERDNFPKNTNNSPSNKMFDYNSQSDTVVNDINHQIKSMRFELQVLNNQNQELIEMLHNIIGKSDYIR
ncbi:hypothetical protein [Leuconostoc pseudomesenteroides]|uniref:hypothetical protein n=1 Tax=Leuconostoc pseudomesenteroides TaxID=33968 RepID=UPI004035D4FD